MSDPNTKNMEKHFEDLEIIRNHFIGFLEEFDLKHLTFIPLGFKNHIFWNCAHALVTQQLLIYYLSGNQMLVDNNWVNRFKKGTFGEQNVTTADWMNLQKWLKSSQKQLIEDYYDGLFTEYETYDTSYGIRLKTVEDAIRFNNLHESLHVGYIMALRKNIG